MFLPPRWIGRKVTLHHVSQASKWSSRYLGAAYCTQPIFLNIRGSSDQNGYRKTLLELLHARGCNVRMVGSRKAGTFQNNEHEGWRGFRIDQIETKARLSAAKLLPHVFTVNAGSNDCLQSHKLDEASSRIGGLVETLWTASPGSTVILSSLIVNRDEGVDLRVRAFNEEVEVLAQTMALEGKRVVFVDMHGDDGPAVGDLVEDGTHPNDAGYRKMAEIWAQGIQAASDRGFLSDAET